MGLVNPSPRSSLFFIHRKSHITGDTYIYISHMNKARFHNYVLTIPEPKPRDSKTKPRDSPTKAGALPQLHSHDSTTTLPRFHNQNLRIPQPNSHDSTTKTSGFHNQNLAILQLTTIDSTRKTAATYFHCRKFLTSYYKKLKSPTPAKQ
jgi:hypothetical protein